MIIQLEDFSPENINFIVFEGVNGAGKSSLLRKIQAELEKANISVKTTHEPGSTPLGLKLRKLLLEPEQPINFRSEVFMFAADRAQHVADVIKPAIENEAVVLCDRFTYSTVAFQGYGRGLDLEEIHHVNSFATDRFKPDLVILLDLDPVVGLQRAGSRGGEDSFEDEEIAFHHRLRDGFLELAEQSEEPFLIVDASKSEDEIFDKIKALIELILKTR